MAHTVLKKITILVYGGLGNQLFQFALGKSISLSNPEIVVKYYDFTNFASTSRTWELGFLNIYPTRISKKDALIILFKKIIYKKFNKNVSNLLRLGIVNELQYDNIHKRNRKEIILDGYWQSETYFYKHKKQIKEILNSSKELLKLGFNFDSYQVAVHVRAGDYHSNKKVRKQHLVCDLNWFKKSIRYLKKINPNFKFTIFTDDVDFVERNFYEFKDIKIQIPDNFKDASKELYKMSNFRNFIISNSSYSWWASYLGETENSIIIAPEYWFNGVRTKNLPIYRSNWILL